MDVKNSFLKLPHDVIEHCIKPFLTSSESITLDIELLPLFRSITRREYEDALLDIEQNIIDIQNFYIDELDEMYNTEVTYLDCDDF